VLTLHCARVGLAARCGAASVLSLVILAMIFSAAYADGSLMGGCIGSGGSANCVMRWGTSTAGNGYIRPVPEPANELEKKRAEDRDHKWEERCHPTIAQDHLGVPRYQYAAPGCEFGVIQ
jgi:hypothetical protein